jgi:hypothetical protein
MPITVDIMAHPPLRETFEGGLLDGHHEGEAAL